MPDLFWKGKKPEDTEIILEKNNLKEQNIVSNESTEPNAPQEKITIKPNLIKISKKLTPFTAFCSYPENFTFKDQEEDEEIILLVRRHFITNFTWILEFIVLLLLPIAFSFLVPRLFPDLNIANFTKTLYLAFYYLVTFGFLLINFSIWYFNIDLITNKRIIDIDISGLLFKNIAETKLELIQDVSYSQIGGIMSIFNFGDCLVQTAGEAPNFKFDAAPNPEKVIHIIGDLIGK